MNPMPNIEITPEEWQIVHDILQRHMPEYTVWAYGSRARRTAKPYSDLDLMVVSDTPLPLAISAALAESFSESDLPWKVDISDWASAGEDFRRNIARDKVVIQQAGLAQQGAAADSR